MRATNRGGSNPPDETQVARLMRLLSIDRAEALQVIEDDKRIDRGEKLFELPEDMQAGAKKARTMPRGSYNFTPRERKEDTDKRALLEQLTNSIEAVGSACDITNPEREFTFTYRDKKYKVVLSCPRS